MEKNKLVVILIVLIGGITIAGMFIWAGFKPNVKSQLSANALRLTLPTPRHTGNLSLEEVFLKRRSIRDYADEPLTLQQISQLLWAAQGITDPRGYRTAPSAGALYPLEVYLVVGNVDTLEAGVYKYRPHLHELVKTLNGDKRIELADIALQQSWVEKAAIDIIITAVYERTTGKYGDRGIRYVHMEAGHAAQNLCLQATAMDLGIVTVGAFDDKQVATVLHLVENEQPLYILPVGKK